MRDDRGLRNPAVGQLGTPPTTPRVRLSTAKRAEWKESGMDTLEKRSLSDLDLDAEAAFVLPPRETMLVTIVINNVLNNLSIDIPIRNNNVAVQVCAVVNVLNQNIGTNLTCAVQQ